MKPAEAAVSDRSFEIPAPGTPERLEYVKNDAISLLASGKDVLVFGDGGVESTANYLRKWNFNAVVKPAAGLTGGEVFDTVCLEFGKLPDMPEKIYNLIEGNRCFLRPGGRMIFCAGTDEGEDALQIAEERIKKALSVPAVELCFHRLNEYGCVLCSFTRDSAGEGTAAAEKRGDGASSCGEDISGNAAITILMPTWNRPELLRQAIESVVKQHCQCWKLLVINDGGEDVFPVVESFADRRISYYTVPHGGKAAALNFALKKVDTPWIGYLDDDEICSAEHFECLLRAVERTGSEAAYNDTSLEWRDVKTGAVLKYCRMAPVDCDAGKLRFQNFINHNHLIHSRKVAEEIGEYDEKLPIYIDYDYVRRISRRFDLVHVNLITGTQVFRCKNGVPDSITGLKQRDPGAAGLAIIRVLGKTPEDLFALYNGFLERGEEINRQYREKVQLENDLEALRREAFALRDNADNIFRDFEEKCAELAAVKAEKEKMQTEIEKLKAALAGAEKEKQSQIELRKVAENKNGELADRLSAAEKIISELEARLAGAENEIELYQHSKSYRYTRLPAEAKRRFWAWRQKFKQQTVYPAMRRTGRMIIDNPLVSDRLRHKLCEHYSSVFSPYAVSGRFFSKQQLIDMVSFSGEAGLQLPPDLPLTSIIIPVYNNIEWTRRCLKSVYSIGSRAPFEVIIVDDCSTDNIASLQKSFPEIRIVRNEKNLGFLRTANAGAAAAKGEYLIFLNNDTEVLPRWLDELATALYRHPEAGMIGSALIHLSTGKLQESGNLICKDGRMMPLGRGQDPKHPEFTAFREVDFSSAASIILRKSDFDAVGGFDEIYAPAYFEDPDLALKLQSSGKKNYVLPLSQVLHQEMASYGGTLDEKCERNRKLFYERWGGYLQKNALYSTPEEINDVRHYRKKRVLYIDAQTPQPDRGSGCMDAVFFMEYMLKRGYEVVFHGEYTPGFDPKYTAILLRMGVECVYEPYRHIWEYIETNGYSFDLVFVSRVYQAQCFDWLIRRYCPNAAYVFNTVDLHFIRERREAEISGSAREMLHAAKTERLEMTFAGNSDGTIVISSEEKKLLDEEYKLERIYHIPQARRVAGCRNPFSQREGMVFIGSAHPPNLDALRYFHDDILPRLNARKKGVKLTVIGEALAREINNREEYRDLAKCKQIEFVGFVENLSDVLDYAKLTIAPLRYGAGTKGKIASSMSCGVPCVSSRFGVEGTGMVDGTEIMVADDPDTFAAAIVRLLEDENTWNIISSGGISFLKRNYAPATVEKQMDDMLEEVFARCRMLNEKFKLLDVDTAAECAVKMNGVSDAELWQAAELWAPRRSGKLFCMFDNEDCRKAAEERCKNTVFEFTRADKADFMVLSPRLELPALNAAAEMLAEGGRMVFSFAAENLQEGGKAGVEAFFRHLKELDFADIRIYNGNIFCAGKIVEKNPDGVENW